MSSRSGRAAIVASLITISFGSAATIGHATPKSAQRADDPPKLHVTAGYRKATRAERRKMNRVDLDLTRRYGWFVGRKDPSFGFVCGYYNGSPWGWGLRRKGKGTGWRAYTEASSGELQNYALMCGAYDS